MRYVCSPPLPNPLARTTNVDLVIASSKSKWIKFISANLLFGTFVGAANIEYRFWILPNILPEISLGLICKRVSSQLPPTGQHSAAEFGLIVGGEVGEIREGVVSLSS